MNKKILLIISILFFITPIVAKAAYRCENTSQATCNAPVDGKTQEITHNRGSFEFVMNNDRAYKSVILKGGPKNIEEPATSKAYVKDSKEYPVNSSSNYVTKIKDGTAEYWARGYKDVFYDDATSCHNGELKKIRITNQNIEVWGCISSNHDDVSPVCRTFVTDKYQNGYAFDEKGSGEIPYYVAFCVNDIGIEHEEQEEEEVTGEPRLDYDSWCSSGTEGNQGIRKAAKILGNIISILKIVVPLIIIVLGMVDFAKAIMADDNKAISKAATSLATRIIAGIIIFFIPTIVMAILNVIEISKGIESDDPNKSNFAACTKCIFKPKTCK